MTNLIIIFGDKISSEFFNKLANIKIIAIPTVVEAIILINFTVKGGDIVFFRNKLINRNTPILGVLFSIRNYLN